MSDRLEDEHGQAKWYVRGKRHVRAVGAYLLQAHTQALGQAQTLLITGASTIVAAGCHYCFSGSRSGLHGKGKLGTHSSGL